MIQINDFILRALLFVEITLWALLLCSMTYYDITMGNNITSDVYCNITMSNDVAMCTYMTSKCITMLLWASFYSVLLCRITFVILVNSLKLYTNIKINIKSIVVLHKNKNKFMVIICGDHAHCFWEQYFTCLVDFWNISMQKQFTWSPQSVHSLIHLFFFYYLCTLKPCFHMYSLCPGKRKLIQILYTYVSMTPTII